MNNLHMKTFRLHCIAAALVLSAALAQAQVKVGDNPTTINPGSVLELESTNKGLLMPRISLTNTTTWGLLGTAAAGMHVYNTNTAITSTNTSYPTLTAKVGEYYWDGTGWVAIGQAVASPYLRLRGAVITATNGASQVVANLTAQLANDIVYTPGSGDIKINKTGIYSYAVTALGPQQPGAPGGVFDFCHAIAVNGTGIDQACGRADRGEGTSSTVAGIFRLNANDIVRVTMSTASGWAGNGAYSFSVALAKLSD